MILNIQGIDSLNSSDTEVLPPSTRSSRFAPSYVGDNAPVQELQKEKDIHRTAAYLVATGVKVKDIAAELKIAESVLSSWLKQTWFQATVHEILQNKLGGDLTSMLKTAASSAVLVMLDLMQNSVDERVKFNAAKDILDRYRGKPTNYVHHTNHQLSEAPDKEIQRLEKELKLT